MTRDEVSAMKPGRKLDALVDNLVMNRYEFTGKHGEWVYPAPRSTNIAAAWEVEEMIYEKGLAEKYITNLILITGSTGFHLVHATPEQRCKAALLAVMGDG
jgi:hypothetical protein